MRPFRLYVCVLAGVVALTASAIQPRKCRFGQVQDLKLTDSVDLKWPPAFGEKPVLTEGKKFAILYVTLNAGKSIGKYDFSLSGGKCLAIAAPDAQFDPTVWEEVADSSAKDVQLLYIVDEAGAPYTMSMEYNIPALPDKHITLLDEPPPAPPEAEAPPAADAPVVEEEGAAPAEAVAAPATDAEATPAVDAAEPEPAPVKEEVKPAPAPPPAPAPKVEAKPAPAPKKEPAKSEVKDFVDDW